MVEQSRPADELLCLARVAEQAERFDDMLGFMEQIIDSKDAELDSDEVVMFQQAASCYAGENQASIRTIVAITQRHQQRATILSEYKARICTDGIAKCKRVLDILVNKLLARQPQQISGTYGRVLVAVVNKLEFYGDEETKQEYAQLLTQAQVAKDMLIMDRSVPLNIRLATEYDLAFKNIEIYKNPDQARRIAMRALEVAENEPQDQLDQT